jgi:phosphate/sulfate permease
MGWKWRDDAVFADDGGLREKAPAEAFQAAAKGPKHSLRRWVLYGFRPEPVPSHFGLVEEPEEDKAGICCSGGGVRSAAFSLGALQALQEEGELKRASYLAAVSGGSYIASAISMVAKVGREDSDDAQPNKDSEQALLDRLGPFAPGSPEEQYLRNRCSYLAPTMTDKIYLGWRVLLGLLINLFAISLPLIGVGLLLAGLLYAPFLPDLAGACNATIGVCKHECAANLPCGFWLLPLSLLALSVLAGGASLLGRWGNEERERFLAIWSVRLLILAALLAVLLVAVPHLVDWVRGSTDNGESTGDVAGGGAKTIGAGTLALLVGVVAQLGHLLSSKEASEELKRGRKLFEKLGKAARLAIVYFAAALAGPLLLLSIFVLAVSAGMAEASADGRVDFAVAGAGLAVLAFFWWGYRLVDLNTWSLNPYYKRRLSSAFALKRVSEENLDPEERDRVEALVPADPESDVGIAIERDFDDMVPISMTALQGGKGREWPTLLVCAAANISDPGATPPGRGVTSFTFSANTVGGPLVGAVRTWELESAFEGFNEAWPHPEAEEEKDKLLEKAAEAVTLEPRRKRRHDLTLPAAMAISGAAISPSMGKMTRRPLTFLMALANIRLGVWVPNPRWIGEYERNPKLRKRYIRPRPLYLLYELIGLNQVSDRYLYVTDGGHYENLGLVELLRRGCTEIYCLDASGVGRDGTQFEALGEAIALARSELGVDVRFDTEKDERNPEKLVPDKESQTAERDVITGTILYPPGPDEEEGLEGKLIYVRNTMTAKAPWDVRAHHEADPRFPNNPTVDQLYTDQKFEAYRALGAQAGARAVAQMKVS